MTVLLVGVTIKIKNSQPLLDQRIGCQCYMAVFQGNTLQIFIISPYLKMFSFT